MSQIELILALLVGVVILATIAERARIPVPVVLVGGGLLLGAIPNIPNVELDPDAVFLLFLPPAIFSAALTTDWPRFRGELRPILTLAVVLVLTTVIGGAVAVFAVTNGVSWDVAFVLGAIVSPPDAVATVAIVRRLGLPRQLISILEGESLINDVTALIAYRYAVAAVVTGSFSIGEAGLDFAKSAILAVIIGLAVSLIITWLVSNLVEDPTIVNVISILAPVAAYLPAEEVHASGVLAVVVAGLVFARETSRRTSAITRLQADAIWRVLLFVIDGLVFMLIGLQLPTVLEGLSAYSWWRLTGYAIVVCGAAILIRLVFVGILLNPRRLHRAFHDPTLNAGWGTTMVIGWAGPRGILTLATALALPYTTDAGSAFPNRDLIIFLAFCVILATLVGQGLTLPFLVRQIRFPADDSIAQEIRIAGRTVLLAALHRLDDIDEAGWAGEDAIEIQRAALRARLARYPASGSPASTGGAGASAIHRRILDEVTAAERDALDRLQRSGTIGEAARRAIERNLDLAEARSRARTNP
jgi:CPA1 family monovalent cation:H+ antiporter